MLSLTGRPIDTSGSFISPEIQTPSSYASTLKTDISKYSGTSATGSYDVNGLKSRIQSYLNTVLSNVKELEKDIHPPLKLSSSQLLKDMESKLNELENLVKDNSGAMMQYNPRQIRTVFESNKNTLMKGTTSVLPTLASNINGLMMKASGIGTSSNRLVQMTMRTKNLSILNEIQSTLTGANMNNQFNTFMELLKSYNEIRSLLFKTNTFIMNIQSSPVQKIKDIKMSIQKDKDALTALQKKIQVQEEELVRLMSGMTGGARRRRSSRRSKARGTRRR